MRVQVSDCAGPLTMARTALLGARVVLANALSAYVVVRTRGEHRVWVTRLKRPVVEADPAPRHIRRKKQPPAEMR
jgi:hypothetical protein